MPILRRPRPGSLRRSGTPSSNAKALLEPLMKREAMSYEGLIALIFGDHPTSDPYHDVTYRGAPPAQEAIRSRHPDQNAGRLWLRN